MSWVLTAQVAVTVVLGAAAALLGGRVVVGVFRWEQSMAAKHPDASSAAPLPPGAGQLRGGAAIGVLERVAIIASVVARYPEGIAIVLAVKGLARYPELKAQHVGAAERFVIGTFVSVLVAVGAAGLIIWLNGLIGGLGA